MQSPNNTQIKQPIQQQTTKHYNQNVKPTYQTQTQQTVSKSSTDKQVQSNAPKQNNKLNNKT